MDKTRHVGALPTSSPSVRNTSTNRSSRGPILSEIASASADPYPRLRSSGSTPSITSIDEGSNEFVIARAKPTGGRLVLPLPHPMAFYQHRRRVLSAPSRRFPRKRS